MADLPIHIQFVLGVAIALNATLTALAGWFLKRYVDRKDRRDDAIISRLTEHDKLAAQHAVKFSQTALEMKQVALDFKKSELDFARHVDLDLASFGKTLSDLRISMHETRTLAGGVSERLADVRKEMTVLYETQRSQGNQLAAGAETISRHAEVIKTILKKLGPNTTLVTTEKKPNED